MAMVCTTRLPGTIVILRTTTSHVDEIISTPTSDLLRTDTSGFDGLVSALTSDAGGITITTTGNLDGALSAATSDLAEVESTPSSPSIISSSPSKDSGTFNSMASNSNHEASDDGGMLKNLELR